MSITTAAFIVRPFGTKKVLQKGNGNPTTVDFNFDLVQEELIMPALKKAGLFGYTTGKIFEAGSIHEDMFSLLLTANLVIADISIHNANVFYELGIRHALRDKQTVLIKCPGFDETPFDIIGYRYVAYKKDDPAASVEDLAKALEETQQANRKDSPVFDKLPKLESQDIERFLAVPEDFELEVRVTKAQETAAKLAMMSTEVCDFTWYLPALRKIGEALYTLRCLHSARTVWEKVLQFKRNDLQANEKLATIYQRLAESELNVSPKESEALFERSNIAIEQILNRHQTLTPFEKAEAYALKARNAKNLWVEAWANLPEADREVAALSSEHLESALQTYEQGYLACLNHYYAGINALGLLVTTITLADKYPNIWELHFATTKLAVQELDELKDKYEALKKSVYYSIEAAKQNVDKNSEEYAWVKITEADFICLTETRPPRVKLSYQNSLREASMLNLDATVRQLLIYQQLGVVKDNVSAALEALPQVSVTGNKIKSHTLLFTGHMMDKPGRAEARFPPDKEQKVREAIKEKVKKEQERVNGNIIGLAGGASGGDIIFHEVCEELGIKTDFYLALPRDQFIAESVAFAGTDWVDRFNNLYTKLSWQVLSQTKELPNWLKKKENYSIWERNNLWMLNQALDNGGLHMSLIALWDGKGGDGDGGTEHMVKEAQARGAKTTIVDINSI